MSGISKQAQQQIERLVLDGMNRNDAHILRRQAMTLQRWFELECGDSNDYRSVAIVRGTRGKNCVDFQYDDDGKPYYETHAHHSTDARAVYTGPIPDRETGARNRINKIMAQYPGWAAYVQTDPRGAALYVLRPADLNGSTHGKPELDQIYTRGVALFK